MPDSTEIIFPRSNRKKTFENFFRSRLLYNCAKKKYLSSYQQAESLKQKVLCSLYVYCTCSILSLHDIVFVLMMPTLIAIMFFIHKKWKTDNKQFVSDILMLCNEEVNYVPYSCSFIFVCRWIFLRTDIRNTNTWKLSLNGHKLSMEIVFFCRQVFDLQVHFFLFW